MAAERGRILAKAGVRLFGAIVAIIGTIFAYFVISSPEAAVNPPLMLALSIVIVIIGLIFCFIGIE